MTEQDWLGCNDPKPMLDFLRGRLSSRKVRLFEVACCRTVMDLLTHEESERAIELAEVDADGLLTPQVRREAAQAADWALAEVLQDTESDDPFAPPVAYAACYLLLAQVDEQGVWQSTPDELAARALASAALDRARGRSLYGLGPWNETAVQREAYEQGRAAALKDQAQLLRELHGNPFRPCILDDGCRTETAKALAQGVYDEHGFERLPILADALEEAGCTSADILDHLRGPGPHLRGCWALDLILDKK